MTSRGYEQADIKEQIWAKPIQFDCGAVYVEPVVAKYLAEHGVAVEDLLAKHQRCIPSAAMDSMDNQINLAAAPEKRAVISVFPAGATSGARGIWLETNDGHTQTKVKFEPTIDELLQLHRPTSPLKNLLRRIFR